MAPRQYMRQLNNRQCNKNNYKNNANVIKISNVKIGQLLTRLCIVAVFYSQTSVETE